MPTTSVGGNAAITNALPGTASKSTATPKPTTATPQPKTPPNAPALIQPPFDARIRRLAAPMAGGNAATPIQRGYMSWDPSIIWPPPYNNSSLNGGTATAASQTWAGAPKVLFLF